MVASGPLVNAIMLFMFVSEASSSVIHRGDGLSGIWGEKLGGARSTHGRGQHAPPSNGGAMYTGSHLPRLSSDELRSISTRMCSICRFVFHWGASAPRTPWTCASRRDAYDQRTCVWPGRCTRSNGRSSARKLNVSRKFGGLCGISRRCLWRYSGGGRASNTHDLLTNKCFSS